MSQHAFTPPPTDPADKQRLGRLLAAGYPCICITTFDEQEAVQLVREVALDCASPLWQWSVSRGVSDGLAADAVAVADTTHPAAALCHLAREARAGIAMMLDLAGHLRDERTLRVLRELIDVYERRGSHLVLIDHEEQVPSVVLASAARLELSLPDDKALEGVLRDTLRRRGQAARLQVELKRDELDIIIQALRGLSRSQAQRLILDAIGADQRLDINDVGPMLAQKRNLLRGSGLLEFVEAPVSLDDIGGLRRLKHWLEVRHGARSAQAARFGLPAPRGILMLGVQGAGKSLAAKAVATAWRWPLMRMDVGALYDRYIGESERRLRDSLHQAERMAPVILWIDEIEKGFASAASHSTDGGLSRRMFASLLTWMQEHSAPVFIIATANDIEALPPELLRKGRFDEIFFVDLPVPEAREQIFRIHLRKRGRDPGQFDLPALVAASDGFSGAEIEQAIVAAMYGAFAVGAELTKQRILEVIATSPPLSVTMAERVAALRAWAEGRCVPAD